VTPSDADVRYSESIQGVGVGPNFNEELVQEAIDGSILAGK
jgi:hypothetical protein